MPEHCKWHRNHRSERRYAPTDAACLLNDDFMGQNTQATSENHVVFYLTGEADLEYLALAFNHEKYLVGLSGVPDHRLTLWDWLNRVRLHTVDTNIRVILKKRSYIATTF